MGIKRRQGAVRYRILAGLTGVLLSTAIVQQGRAATFGLQNDWCLNPPAGAACGNTGLQQSGPITNTNSSDFPGDNGVSFSGSMTETSSYGNLSVSGSGTVSNSVSGGALGFVGTFDSPGFDVGGVPLAYYTDILTITGTGPVNIQFTVAFSDMLTASANAQVSLADQIVVNGGAGWNDILNGPGTATEVLTFNPGDQVTIAEGLLGGGAAYAPDLAPPLITPNFSYMGSDLLSLDVLTSGGGYTAASGTAYATSAPEPVSTLLLGTGLLGLALLGKFARRRPDYN